MIKTIPKDKTIMILAIATAFLAGSAITSVMSEFEAEAKEKASIEDVLAAVIEGFGSTGNDHGVIEGKVDAVTSSTGNDHGVIIGKVDTVDGKADGIKSVVDTIDAKVP